MKKMPYLKNIICIATTIFGLVGCSAPAEKDSGNAKDSAPDSGTTEAADVANDVDKGGMSSGGNDIAEGVQVADLYIQQIGLNHWIVLNGSNSDMRLQATLAFYGYDEGESTENTLPPARKLAVWDIPAGVSRLFELAPQVCEALCALQLTAEGDDDKLYASLLLGLAENHVFSAKSPAHSVPERVMNRTIYGVSEPGTSSYIDYWIVPETFSFQRTKLQPLKLVYQNVGPIDGKAPYLQNLEVVVKKKAVLRLSTNQTPAEQDEPQSLARPGIAEITAVETAHFTVTELDDGFLLKPTAQLAADPEAVLEAVVTFKLPEDAEEGLYLIETEEKHFDSTVNAYDIRTETFGILAK